MYDVIMKKKAGGALSAEEIDFFVRGYTCGEIPDYQASALLMAICFNGMDTRETALLTMAMAKSGDMADLSGIDGVKVDKHSTGGVGDKTTLIAAPIAAALGVKVAKMSGRGLGHTGGTVDKLEAIPGFRSQLSGEEFTAIAKSVGLVVAGQSGNLAPADKKLYALRDVTGTVDCLPLIASSIMSKKLASGADKIVLDVKAGAGAFMKTLDEARALALAMVGIAREAGREAVAILTGMEEPLGRAVGNAIEVAEAVDVLKGGGSADLALVSKRLAREMALPAGVCDEAGVDAMIEGAVSSGAALAKLAEMVAAQGGDAGFVYDPARFGAGKYSCEILAETGGYVQRIDALAVGEGCCLLGAGRETAGDGVDPLAGVWIERKRGEAVLAGVVLARCFAGDEGRLARGAGRVCEGELILGVVR